MAYEKFTSAERRGLLLLTGLLTAAICAVAIARGCSGGDRLPLPPATPATLPPTTTDNIAETTADGDSTATRQYRKKRTRKNAPRLTPAGRERSHRDESVLDHNTISADNIHENGQ